MTDFFQNLALLGLLFLCVYQIYILHEKHKRWMMFYGSFRKLLYENKKTFNLLKADIMDVKIELLSKADNKDVLYVRSLLQIATGKRATRKRVGDSSS